MQMLTVSEVQGHTALHSISENNDVTLDDGKEKVTTCILSLQADVRTGHSVPCLFKTTCTYKVAELYMMHLEKVRVIY